MEQTKAIIKTILEQGWEGKRSDLLSRIHKAQTTDWSPDISSDRTMRRAVAELVDEGFPIGSSPDRGYFLVKTQKDYDGATKALHSKAMAILRRERKLKIGAEDAYTVQLKMPGVARQGVKK